MEGGVEEKENEKKEEERTVKIRKPLAEVGENVNGLKENRRRQKRRRDDEFFTGGTTGGDSPSLTGLNRIITVFSGSAI